MKAAAVGRLLGGQQKRDLLDPFAEAGMRFVLRDAEAAELVRQEGAREADFQPAVDAILSRIGARLREPCVKIPE